jgi:hypothetical protein
MRILAWVALIGLASAAQDKSPSPLGGGHDSRDARKCKVCAPALQKAIEYVGKHPPGGRTFGAPFAGTLLQGWLGLIDGTPATDPFLKKAVSAASRANAGGFNGNWIIAMAGSFLTEVHRHRPDDGLKAAFTRIADEAAKNQHFTGGWHHNKKFKMQGYSDDLGVVTAMLFGTFCYMKSIGLPVREEMFKKAEDNLHSLLSDSGIDYGTGLKSGDIAGSRGAYAFLGLHAAGRTDHEIYKTMLSAFPGRFPNADKGHAVGALHFLSVALAAYRMGPEMYDKFAAEWIDKCLAKQDPDGGILLGDDAVGGGEGNILGGKSGSTAVFAIMLLLQQPGRFDPPKKNGPARAEKNAPGGPSPFSRKTIETRPK